MIKIGEVSMTWVPDEEQLADLMTKAGAPFHKLQKVLRNGQF